MRRIIAAMAVGAVLATSGPPISADAIDQSKGRPGFCQNGTGVTVVVDFQQLGGTTIVRCNPQATRGTGLDALKGAGFQIAGVQRWGEGFVCRIENRPSAVETVPVKGREDYREACVDTPPPAAYWSYWHAGNNCPWTYSQWGVKNRDFTAGGFEGWSFSLNATADTNPKPRIAAVRPGTGGEPCTATKEPAPTSNDPNIPQPGSGGQRNGSGQSTSGADHPAPATTAPGPTQPGGALPPPKPRTAATATADDPADNTAFTGGENAADVDEVLKKQAGASAYAPWAAAGAVLLLALGTWLTARRRHRARET
jgi:hypothetical protein